MLSPEYKRHVTRPYDILWSRKTLYREGLTQDSYQCIKSIDYLIHGWHSLHDWVRGLCVKSVTKSKIKPTHPVKGYKRKKGPLNRCICCWRDIFSSGNNFSTPQGVPYIEVPLLRLPLAVILPSLEIPLSRKGDRVLSWVSPVRSCPAHSSLSNHARTFKKSNHIHEKEIQGNTAHCK